LAEDKTKDSKRKTITTKIDLMTPDQVRMIREDEAIVISANLKPVYLKGLKGYYQDSAFKKFAKF